MASGKNYRHLRIYVLVSIVLFIGMLFSSFTHQVRAAAYEGSQPDPVEIWVDVPEDGRSVRVDINIRNTGTSDWTSSDQVYTKGQTEAERRYQSESYRNIFQRFWKEGKPDYRALITILASCGCVKINVYETHRSQTGMEEFIDSLNSIITNDHEKFVRHYCYAYEAIMAFLRSTNQERTDQEMQKKMFDDLRSSNFDALYDLICMFADGRESDIS
jgi:hypothetical protein